MANAKKFLLFGQEDSINKYAVFVDNFSTDVAAGSVNGTFSSDGRAKRVVVDTENKISISGGSLVFAGGKVAPDYNDPSIGYTNPDDSVFDLGRGSALLVTITPTVADQYARFGIGPTLNVFDNAMFRLVSSAVVDTILGGVQSTLMPYSASETYSFLWCYKNDDYGVDLLNHIAGKQWKRLSVTPASVLATGYPFIGSYSSSFTISRIALLDLSSLMPGDFSEVTDTKTNPANGTTFDCDGDFHANWTVTHENTKQIWMQFRRIDGNNVLVVQDNGSGDLILYEVVASATNTLATYSGVLSDGVAYEVDVTAEGTSVSVFLDKVLKGTSTHTGTTTTAAGRVDHQLATNDIVLTTYPYPALGGSYLGATDRVVCPQVNDTGTNTADSYTVVRGILVPSANNFQLQQRVTGTDEVTYDVDSAGKPILYDNATARITGSNGDVVDADDVQIKLQGANGEIWSNGTSRGTSTAIAVTTGTTWKVAALGTAGGADAIEFWPYYPMLPFKL